MSERKVAPTRRQKDAAGLGTHPPFELAVGFIPTTNTRREH